MPTIEIAYSQSQRLKQMKIEADSTKQKLQKGHLIERAKAIIAKERGISEGEAYRELQRISMNKRCPLIFLAETVVKSNSERETVNKAKRFIMSNKKISEETAFKQMKAYSEAHGVSMQEVAHRVLSGEIKKR
jgi:response regulator NasT